MAEELKFWLGKGSEEGQVKKGDHVGSPGSEFELGGNSRPQYWTHQHEKLKKT